MEEDTVVGLPRPGGAVGDDPLRAVLRDGARRRLTQAIEAEVTGFLVAHADRRDDFGRQRLVRNGHAPERAIQTGIGPIAVQRPRVRDRTADKTARIRFTSAVLPADLRRPKNVEKLLPWLDLKGISSGQFEETLAVLLGPDAPGLSATTIRRLVAAWQDEPWKHIRTGNPIESTFATVRLRTDKSKGCRSRPTALAFVFKLTKLAERHWRRLNGSERRAEIIEGVRFRDGEPATRAEDQAAARSQPPTLTIARRSARDLIGPGACAPRSARCPGSSPHRPGAADTG